MKQLLLRPVTTCLAILFTATIFTACSNDKKEKSSQTGTESGESNSTSLDDINYTAMASDLCDCVSDLENSLSETSKELFIRISQSEDPAMAMEMELQSMDEKQQEKIANEMNSIGQSNAGKCMEDFEKKYAHLKSPENKEKEKEAMLKLVNALEEDCSKFSASMLRAGLREMEKQQ